MVFKFTLLNFDFIENLPSNILSELIVLEDVIPDGIMVPMYFHNPLYEKERNNFLEYRPDLLEKMYQARADRERLSEKEERINIKTDENIHFIKKYPQYMQLINSVEYTDDDFNTVKVVPIEQYLAEN